MSQLYKLKKKASPESSSPSRSGGVPPLGKVTIDFKQELNEQQYEAVTSPPGQALVLAGAGSGKTRTLTYRVAYLLANAVAADNILLLTFTNKAAREMLERVDALLPGQVGGLWSGTFHSICNRILRRNAEATGLTRQFTILDSEDAKSLLSKVIKENKALVTAAENATHSKFPKAAVIGGLISLSVNTKVSLEAIVEAQFSANETVIDSIKRIARFYDKKKRESNALDFDDLMTRVLELFAARPEILARYQYQFQFILVDEYQDTNPVQSDLINALAGEHGNVMVVGDDAQSIYSWRGADFKNIISFPQRFPEARVYCIETNYRSTAGILNVANDVIKQNRHQFPKKLKPACGEGSRPVVAAVHDPREQAAFVTQRMQELHDAEGIPWNEMAVLYRAHFHSMELQMELTTERVPFVITSGLKFFEQAHIKDFTAYLKLTTNPRDEAAFDRIAQMLPGVGPGSALRMWGQWLSSGPGSTGKPPALWSPVLAAIKAPPKAAKDWEQLGYTLDEFMDGEELHRPDKIMESLWKGIYEDYIKASFENAEHRSQDVQQFIRFASQFETLEALLSEMSLLSGPESAEQSRNKKEAAQESVVLSSIHQAKGLEWKVVFIIWLTDGMFPNGRVLEKELDAGLEEERRLFYVAVTRAREQLYMLYPKIWPKSYDGDMYQQPSRFLTSLSRAAVEEWRMH